MVSREFNRALADTYGVPQTAMIRKAFDTSTCSETTLVELRGGVASECCVVFSDISGFSGRVRGWKPSRVREFLQEYYDRAIPIIGEHGGLVDQIMGDGIISVYSDYFVPDIGDVVGAGLAAAKGIVKHFASLDVGPTKCALHKDRALLCEIGAGLYRQTTIIGNVMTAVYRLESVARDRSVSMLCDLPDVQLRRQSRTPRFCFRLQGNWTSATSREDLKGIEAGQVKVLHYTYHP